MGHFQPLFSFLHYFIFIFLIKKAVSQNSPKICQKFGFVVKIFLKIAQSGHTVNLSYIGTLREVDFFVFLMGHSLPLLCLFLSFQQLTVNFFIIKFCWWLDSNRGHLVLEATALPTKAQPLPKRSWYFVRWQASLS